MSDSYEIEALNYAKLKHGDQKRKYTGEPYWTHPLSVSTSLKGINSPVNVLMAAILHDTIEDTDATYEEICNKFSNDVADLVLEVTDVSKPSDGNRELRKDMDLNHLSKSSYWGATIKLADMIDNSRSIVKHDPGFAKIYLKEKARALEVLRHGNPLLLRYAKDILDLSIMYLDHAIYDGRK